ncbi:hypothetical protein Prum_067020 [Phytohabitans rumicis]|uniref:Uncharacterized protein n=2 Tax=Phytohabitans rumicis TaxID=1076125 RepID=A0A6V8LBQ3_9ACTN|nr:hypothetical protein Prum_067020 [Phytohabitans rumicis]
MVQRLAREYGWLGAAVGLGTLVLLCSVPFVSGTSLTWNSAQSVTAESAEPAPFVVPTPLESVTQVAPPTAAPTPAPSWAKPKPTASSRQPVARSSPTPRRTTAAPPREPVLLGPSDSGQLWGITDAWCKQRDRDSYVQPGQQGDGRWWCFRWGVPPTTVDMNAACRIRYGSSAFAQTSNGRDPNAWRCYRS